MATNATAFTHTPQAKDDVYSWTEDALLGSGPLSGNVVTLAVMVNDLGGNAKTLYSVDDGNGNTLVPDFDLLSPDVTNGVSAWEATAAGNQIRINNGRIEFRLAGSLSNLGASDVNALAAGDLVRDEFVYAIRMANGTLSQARVTFSLAGTNDAPVITQGPQSGAVKEDETLTASGQFTATDADHNATQTWSVQGSAAGSYGAMAVDATGEWTYTLANGAVAVQALAAGESHDETFTIRVTDDQGAYADQTVKVTISGTNDTPVVTNSPADAAGAVKEDTTLAATGQLAASDVDHGATQAWSVQGSAAGSYGAMAVDATGKWTYSLDNGASAVQALAVGESRTETFISRVTDDQGAYADQAVKVTVSGTNDAPVMALADTSGTVTARPAETGGAPSPIVFTVQQYLGFQSNNLATLRNYTGTHQASYTVQTNVIDYTDDPGGFAGELPGSSRWPAAEAQNVNGTGGINNTFFARISANFLVPTADTYTFRTYNDDGVFLLIDNQLVISDTGYHPEIAFNGSIALAPGSHSLELFFFENGGEASLELSARSSTGPFGLLGASGGGLGGGVQITDSGAISFSDVDLSDGHIVSAAPVGTTVGSLTAVKASDTTGTGTGGLVDWNYTVDNARLESLAEGERKYDRFDITVDDQHGGVAVRQVEVSIVGVNDAPRISSSAQSGSVTEAANNSADEINNVVHQATGTLAFVDVDLTDAHTVSVSGNATPGYRGTLSASIPNPSTGDGSGAIAWTFAVADGVLDDLAQGQVLTQTYSIAVNDGHGGTASRDVVITLTGAADNSPPVAVNDSPATNEDVPFSFNILANDIDVDGQTLSAVNISPLSNTALGTLQNLGSGKFSFNPAANASGTTSFSYQANDGQVNSGNTATVTITVNATNDAPVIGFTPANIVTNGSFEQPGYWLPTMPTTGSTAITGWTVIGDSVDYIGYQMWQPADGAFSVDLDGNAPGGVQQTLVTAPGAQYTVTFAHGANASGGGNRTVEVTAPGVDNTYTLNNVTNVAWTPETFTFTATGSTSTLSFKSLTPGASGPTLDSVSVVSNTVVTNEDTAVAISGLSVSDIDAGSDAMRLTLGVGHGALALASTAGLTMVDGNGGDGTLSFTGLQSSINAALGSGVVYTPSLDYNGADALTATINDQGHNGSGGPLSATRTVAITVNPVDDGPSFVPFVTGVLPGYSSSYIASNPRGDVVGTSDEGSGYGRYGFLYDHATATFTRLSTDNRPYPTLTTPTAINAAGDVVGSAPGVSSDTEGFLYHNGSYTFIRAGGAFLTVATAVSSDRYVGGTYYVGDGNTYAFLHHDGITGVFDQLGGDGPTPRAIGAGAAWVTGNSGDRGWIYNGGSFVGPFWDGYHYKGGQLTYLNVPGMTRTISVNFDTSGDVSGTYIDTLNAVHGFVYTSGAFETFSAPNGGVMNVNSVNAVADGGRVAGSYTGTDGRVHGFFYDNGVVTGFDAPSGNINQVDNQYWATPSGAMAIGPGDEVTGAYTGSDGHVHGFIYSTGVVSSFDVPGIDIPNPKAIDTDGHIIGIGYNPATYSSQFFMGDF